VEQEWYRQVRGLNRNAHAFLVGTKYDIFTTLPPEEQQDIDKMVSHTNCHYKSCLLCSVQLHPV
jgi:GTPase SAR1 family protein